MQNLIERARALNAEDAEIFDRVLIRLNELFFEGSGSRTARRKRLIEVEKYLTKKSSRVAAENVGNKAEYLRFIRNSFTHRSSVPPEAVSLAIPMFWAILLNSAPIWDIKELSHLLAYAIGSRDEYPGDQIVTGEGVIRHFQTLFKKVPASKKNEVFRELLLSIFVTQQFQEALSAQRP